MCERKDARAAQDNAADALTAACTGVRSDKIGRALKAIYNSTLFEPLPDDMAALVKRLSEHPSVRR